MTFTLPEPNQLTQIPDHKKSQVLDNLFEPCPTLTNLLITNVFNPKHPYTSYRQLIESCREFLLTYLKQEETKTKETKQIINPDISKIIAAHPRLGGAKPQTLSDHSSAEQKSLQGSEEEAQKLLSLNQAYEAKFPGLRYIVFVNGRPRTVIMDNMVERINRGDIELERKEAFNAMCDIAIDRARKLGAKL